METYQVSITHEELATLHWIVWRLNGLETARDANFAACLATAQQWLNTTTDKIDPR